MKSFLTLVSLATLFCGQATAEPKPNVLFIMADDQGSVDLGCYPKNEHPGELYDLRTDLAQKHNLYATETLKVKELTTPLASIRVKGQVR